MSLLLLLKPHTFAPAAPATTRIIQAGGHREPSLAASSRRTSLSLSGREPALAASSREPEA